MGNVLRCCRRSNSDLKSSTLDLQSNENTPLRLSSSLGASSTRNDEAIIAEFSRRCINLNQTLDVSSVYIVENEGHKEVNEFTLIKTIGKGTYGKVKLVLNRNDGNFYAIKMLNKRLLQRKRTVGMNNAWSDVLREVAIMRRLHHDNIVRLHQVIDDPESDILFLVMELMEGGCIQGSELEEGPIGEFLAHSYFVDIIHGLEYIHNNKVIHRDIKPQNLLLSENGVAKLSDFGVAQEFQGEDDSLQRTVGTPAFYSPELCSAGSVPRGRPSDVWALGVSLFCFVFGRVPFAGEHLMHLYENIKNTQLEFPAECSPHLAGLLTAMLEKHPNQRITIDQIKAHPWFLTVPPVDASQPSLASSSNPTTICIDISSQPDPNNRFIDLDMESAPLSSSASDASTSSSDDSSQ